MRLDVTLDIKSQTDSDVGAQGSRNYQDTRQIKFNQLNQSQEVNKKPTLHAVI